jgi:CubicO group peptidase (beta-lactamase class C family)
VARRAIACFDGLMRTPRLAPLAAFAGLIAACGHPAAPQTPPELPGPSAPTSAGSAAAAIDAAHLEAQLTPYIQSLGAKLGERRKLSGYVLVAQHDRPVYAHAFGFADREHQVAADADTSFRIGSVTKQFTAAAILVLQQDGLLSVDDPIAKYLPAYPAVGKDITLHQLLTHTSGIPSYTELPGFAESRAQPRTPQQLLALFWDKPLDFAPGSKFAYSNSNYIVLGAIIEAVSHGSYADFVAKRLFAPAGMTRTVVGDADGLANRALGYEPDDDGLVPASAIDMSEPYAAGAVRSTASDLVRWHRALAGDTILTAASKARAYKVEKEDYAYGWVVRDHAGHQVIGHDGGIDGFETMYLRVPDLDLVIVVWSNNTGVHPQPIGEAALEVALGGNATPVEEPATIALDDAIAARTVGRYKLTDDGRAAAAKAGVSAEILDSVATLELTRAGKHLVMKPVGQDALPLESLGASTYLQLDIGATVELSLPATGNATALTITQGGLTLAFVRDDPPAPPAKKPTGKTPPARK